MPPFGHSTQLRVFVDSDLLQYDSVKDFVCATAGMWNDVFGAAPADVLCGWWCCYRLETRLTAYRLILRRLVSTSPVAVKRSPIMTIIDELSPVSGRESAFFNFVMLGTVVAVTTVVVGATVAGTVTMIDCGEPLMVVRELPFVKPTEKDDVAVRVDVIATPSAMAELVAAMVHTVDEV